MAKFLELKLKMPPVPGLPVEFSNFLRDARALAFDQDPEYDTLRGYLDSLAKKIDFKDCPFDWEEQTEGCVLDYTWPSNTSPAL